MTRVRPALPLALLALVVAAPTASAAAPETRIVPAEFSHEHGAGDKTGTCSAVTFIRWAAKPGEVASRVLWTRSSGAKREQAVKPPYDDSYRLTRAYQVAAGYHWSAIGKTWRLGSRPNDCSDFHAKHMTAYEPGSARVELIPQPDGIDWTMPERLTPKTAKKHFTDIGLPTKAFLDPKTWEAKLFLTREGEPMGSACSTGGDVRWKWVVKPDDRVKSKVERGCRLDVKVTRLGDYDVTATKERLKDGKWERELKVGPVKVTVDDIILAGLGDSSASGEGNAPFYFKACDRSVTSYQFQTAEHVEEQDPRTSVTFLHPACSGARLDHMWKNPYRGTHGDKSLPPQITQIAKRLRGMRRDPEVDAVVAGIGVNDIAFGPVMGFCITKLETRNTGTYCPDRKVRPVKGTDGFVRKFAADSKGERLEDRINRLLADLRPRYQGFMSRVREQSLNNGLGLRDPARVLLSQYPNFSTDRAGVCSTLVSMTNIKPPRWSQRTWGWMGNAAEVLSGMVRDYSGLGYTPIPLDQNAFYGRGYCVTDKTPGANSLFVGVFQSLGSQYNHKGGFHPNAEAHAIMAAPAKAQLCNALYGNPTCEGRFGG